MKREGLGFPAFERRDGLRKSRRFGEERSQAHFQSRIPQPRRRDHPLHGPSSEADLIQNSRTHGRPAQPEPGSTFDHRKRGRRSQRSGSSTKTLTDRSYGARPLRRALQKYIEDPLSDSAHSRALSPLGRRSSRSSWKPTSSTIVRWTPRRRPKASCCTKVKHALVWSGALAR